MGACPSDAWHLVGSPGLAVLGHASGAMSVWATVGGMTRLADRSGVLSIGAATPSPTDVTFGVDDCRWTFDHDSTRVERMLVADRRRPSVRIRWVVDTPGPVVVRETWRVSALPLVPGALMSRRVAPPSTHRGVERIWWRAMFTVSDISRRLTDRVRLLVGRRHPLRCHTRAGEHTLEWAPQRRRRRPPGARWFIAVPPTLRLAIDPPPEGVEVAATERGVALSIGRGGRFEVTGRLELDDPILGPEMAGHDTEVADTIPSWVRAGVTRAAGADAARLLAEAEWHVGQLRALRVPDPAIGSTFVMQGSAYGFVHGIHGAVRDEAFVVAALAAFDPSTARDALVAAASMARPDGTFHYAHCGFGGTASAGVHESPTDLPLFFLWAVCRYVAESGDESVLDEAVVPRGQRGSRGRRGSRDARLRSTSTVARVMSVCVEALRERVGFGPHGMLRAGSGDWADPISLMVRRRRAFHRDGESTFNTAMALAVLPDVAKLIEERDPSVAAACRLLVDALDVAFESAWNGRWYLRGWDGRGGPIGAGHCFLDAQVWAVIAGHGSSERRATLVDTVGELLDDPSPVGPTIIDHPHRVRMGMLADGWDCNGGVWAALGGLAVTAFARHDRGRACSSLVRQSLEHRRLAYPDVWYGQWSGPDAVNSRMGDRPGETFVQPATPMVEFPAMNSNVHAGALLGLLAVARAADPPR